MVAAARASKRDLIADPDIEATNEIPFTDSRANASLAFREDSHFQMMRPLQEVRERLLEAGRRLYVFGILLATDDIWHLRWEEVQEITDPLTIDSSQIAHLRRKVSQRRRTRDCYGGAPLISPESIRRRRRGKIPKLAIAAGSPASSGSARGLVRVVLDPKDFSELRQGEVLVCPYTNPTWTILFLRAAAVVVDTGSVGSHAAITAREYGIPAVMGTVDGTAVLRTGDEVIVDGTSGFVYLAGPDPRA